MARPSSPSSTTSIKSQEQVTRFDAQLQPWSTIGETMVTKVTSGDGPDFVTTGADNGQGWSIDGTFQCVTDFYDDKDNGTDEYIENVVDQITFNIDGSEEKCGVPMGYARPPCGTTPICGSPPA